MPMVRRQERGSEFRGEPARGRPPLAAKILFEIAETTDPDRASPLGHKKGGVQLHLASERDLSGPSLSNDCYGTGTRRRGDRGC